MLKLFMVCGKKSYNRGNSEQLTPSGDCCRTDKRLSDERNSTHRPFGGLGLHTTDVDLLISQMHDLRVELNLSI